MEELSLWLFVLERVKLKKIKTDLSTHNPPPQSPMCGLMNIEKEGWVSPNFAFLINTCIYIAGRVLERAEQLCVFGVIVCADCILWVVLCWQNCIDLCRWQVRECATMRGCVCVCWFAFLGVVLGDMFWFLWMAAGCMVWHLGPSNSPSVQSPLHEQWHCCMQINCRIWVLIGWVITAITMI